MPLNSGEKLGPYEILNTLGEGGMGVVYRAKDSKLKREIAIKVLPETFVRDAAAAARFQREAEALASLNHPNIGAIYDIAEAQDSKFLVLELIEGETLAERIARGRIPLDEALTIARQIAEGLEAAHEKGVIHRDLKPGNVKLTPGGVAKVLDFGIAKTRTVEDNISLTDTPTMATTSTMPGMILGTAAYMPPEQAKGKVSDRTADVWSFGCVLYEMLTGQPPFRGETVGEILAEVLKSEPDWSLLPANTPAGIRRLLKRCLRKDPRSRLRDIGDARIEILDAASEPEMNIPATAAKAAPESRLRERIVWLALLVLMLGAGLLGARFFSKSASIPEIRVDIATAPTFDSVTLAISPDGQKIVYSAEIQGRSPLWVRELDTGNTKVLPGTSGGLYAFWSPDNRNLGFFADNRLKVIDTETGAIRLLANAPNARGASWSPKGVIIFTPYNPGFVNKIPAAGGKPEPVTQLDPGQQQGNHLFPVFLPDGEHFLYFNSGVPEIRGVYVQSLSGGKPKRVLEGDAVATYSQGHLLFGQNGKLMAQVFDPNSLTLSGTPVVVAENVVTAQRPTFDASPNGTLIYRSVQPATSNGTPFYFAWLDRSGKELSRISEMLSGGHWSLSLDGLNFTQEKGSPNIDIWRYDFARGLRNRVTSNPITDTFPIWSPNNERIVFTSGRKSTVYDLYTVLADKPDSDELLLSSSENKIATDWSRDGRYILYRNFSEANGYDVFALPVDASGRKNGDPIAIVGTSADERDAQFSPDGKWVAFQSNETGIFEIYVQPFPGGGAKYQVSKDGGTQVRWNPTGKELFYISLDGKVTSVPMKLDTAGQHFEAGTPVALFQSTMRGNEIPTTNRQQYAVSADGQKFFMRGNVPTPSTAPIMLILNWKPKS